MGSGGLASPSRFLDQGADKQPFSWMSCCLLVSWFDTVSAMSVVGAVSDQGADSDQVLAGLPAHLHHHGPYCADAHVLGGHHHVPTILLPAKHGVCLFRLPPPHPILPMAWGANPAAPGPEQAHHPVRHGSHH